MQLLAGLSVLLFILVGTAVGVRMLTLASRTGSCPERLMGLVLVCGLGYPASLFSGFGKGSVGEVPPADAPCIDSTRGWLLLGMLGYTGSFLSSAVEGLLQRRMALRRLALGLADPVVANRFLLWGLFGLMATGINLASAAGVVLGLDPAESLLVLLPMGILGAAASALMYLAFFPPAWSVGWLRGPAAA